MSVIIAVVQDENGNQIGERVDLLTDLIPDLQDSRFICLRFVDPYGDTVFNCLQVQAILDDLRLLRTTAKINEQQSQIIHRIETLAGVCQKSPHLYLKFIGA